MEADKIKLEHIFAALVIGLIILVASAAGQADWFAMSLALLAAMVFLVLYIWARGAQK